MSPPIDNTHHAIRIATEALEIAREKDDWIESISIINEFNSFLFQQQLRPRMRSDQQSTLMIPIEWLIKRSEAEVFSGQIHLARLTLRLVFLSGFFLSFFLFLFFWMKFQHI